MRKSDGWTIRCECVCHGESDGWERVVPRDGEWFYGHWCSTREAMEAETAALKATYAREGSTLIG